MGDMHNHVRIFKSVKASVGTIILPNSVCGSAVTPVHTGEPVTLLSIQSVSKWIINIVQEFPEVEKLVIWCYMQQY